MIGGQTLQRGARRLYRQMVQRAATDLGEADLRRSAIIFAPHYDDETLGCGGTIIKKKRAGAELAIAFLTDGSVSHHGRLDKQELSALRHREGLAAARVLGVEDSNVLALQFPDGELSRKVEDAIPRVIEVLRERCPEQIFVPYRYDWTPDHVATNRIVSEAVRLVGSAATLYEYPVWFWGHWPWASRRHLERTRANGWLRNSAVAFARLRRERKTRVYIADVARQKRTALDEHASQMCRPAGEASWPVLSDVWDGAFLECFFQDFEIFACRKPDSRVSNNEAEMTQVAS